MAPTKRSNNNANAKATTPAGSVKRSRRGSAQPPLDEIQLENDHAKQEVANDDTLIDSRQNDFSERSWWLVDIDSPTSESSTTQGATSLVKRCMRAYSWSLPQTRKILSSYRQFLSLKKILGDWDATLLSPSHLVDLMWHQHILDNYNYYHDMVLLCGHFVGHNPDGALDVEAKRQRDESTRKYLRQNFGSYDTEVWDHISLEPSGREQSNADVYGRSGSRANNDAMEALERVTSAGQGVNNGNGEQNNDAMGDRNRADNVAREANVSPAAGHENRDETIRFRLRDWEGEVTMIKVKRTTRMRKVFHTFAQRKGVEVNSLRFFFDGGPVSDDETPGMLEMDDDEEIDVLRAQNGC